MSICIIYTARQIERVSSDGCGGSGGQHDVQSINNHHNYNYLCINITLFKGDF